VQKLLEETEGTQPPARPPADEEPDETKHADQIERQCADDYEVLQRPDRTRAPGERARVAVEDRDTGALEGPLIEARPWDGGEVGVGGKKSDGLDDASYQENRCLIYAERASDAVATRPTPVSRASRVITAECAPGQATPMQVRQIITPLVTVSQKPPTLRP